MVHIAPRPPLAPAPRSADGSHPGTAPFAYFGLCTRSRERVRLLPVILRRDEKVRIISRVPLFEACSQAELARIATITTQSDVPDGEVLIREGEAGDLFFVLVTGTAEVRKGRYRVGTLGPGDFAGEIALLTTAPTTATVRTTSPVTALRATRKGFSALLETSPKIQGKLLRALADRLAPTAL